MLSKSVISAFAAAVWLVPLAGCQNGGEDFVGTTVATGRGLSCGLCTTDPVPEPVDCAAVEQGTEFLPIVLWDFESGGTANNMYVYSDGTGLTSNLTDTWRPATTPALRCIGGDPANSAFHLKAGPFTNWGGAIGRHFKCLNGSGKPGEIKIGTGTEWGGSIGCDPTEPANSACVPPSATATPEELLKWSVCPERDKRLKLAAAALSTDPDNTDPATADPGSAGQDEYMLNMTLDLTAWDGISFWARRSSDSQAGIRISVGDRYTDDDLSYLQQHINPDDRRACERNVECGCNGNSACYALNGEATMRCWDSPPRMGDPEGLPPECGQSLCTDGKGVPHFYDALQHADWQRENTTCHPHTFHGGIQGDFCYNASNPPQENSELCGDHWAYPVYLSTEWKFFKVPFTSLLQQGWAKKFDKFDPSTAALIRFQWGTGWLDVWLDDVRVYRDTLNTGH